jgi:7-cyano-7-deazaguanine synthase
MKVVVVLSGGVDSTTLLYRLKAEGKKVTVLSFDYGQRHGRQELLAAFYTCEALKVPRMIVNIEPAIHKLIDRSALTGDMPVPEGRYDAESMKSTVVPGRNLIMASIALAYASNIEADAIALGMHAGDHAIYPDCRPEFILALGMVARFSSEPPIQVLTPYLYYNKWDIVKDGISLGVDYSLTWSCYIGGKTPCGKCGTCVERAEAFQRNGIEDPLLQQRR